MSQINIIKKKLNFIRYNSEHLTKLGSHWRKQKGLHNKVRLKKKGHSKSPSIGYSSPREIKGLYKSEFNYKLINSEKDLENLEQKYIMLSSNLGLKKRLQIINKIKPLDIKILNIKNIDDFVKNIQEKLKQNKDKKLMSKQKKQESTKKVQEKLEKDKTGLTQEEKAEKEKLEKKKILEKGQ